ncbi:MAG: CPBP family intramembrane metalloprotease [Alistipes sp.]|nr:CPBP family intramembrane metalloprotease [Alistipes sp.]MBR2629724.1 CPBP family intramembrane metalloprotease [Alistipes sp.]
MSQNIINPSTNGNSTENIVENSAENNPPIQPENSVEVGETSVAQDEQVTSLGEPSPSRGFKWYDAIVILLMFFLSQGVGAFVAVKLGCTPPDMALFNDADFEVVENAESMQARFVAVTFVFAIIICFIALTTYRILRKWQSHISFRSPSWGAPFRLLCGYLLLWCISITIEPITARIPADQSALGAGGWLLLSAVVLAPLLEEVVFRGYITSGLQYAYGPITAWIISSLIFGIAHGDIAPAINATFCGLVLGFYYMRYRSLMLVIMLHSMNNLTACFLSAVDLDQTPISDILGGGKLYWGIYALCLVVTLLSFVRMYNSLKRLKSNKSAY